MFQSGDLVQLKSDSDCSDWAILKEEKDFLRHPPLKVDACQESTSPGLISNITFKYQNQDNQQKELKLLLSTLSYFEPWKPSFQVGDLVRIVCASQFKNRVFKIEEITNDNFNHQFKLSNKFYYSSSEIESAGSGSIQVGDHVLITEKGNYFNKIGVVTRIPSIFIYVIDKNNKATSFYPCNLTLVESSTPLSDFYSKEMPEFKVGDLVRVITFSLKEDPTVYKITEMSYSNQLYFWEIRLSNGLWYSLKSIRPAAPIQVGDHVLINESSGSFHNKIAAVKIIETTVIWLIDKNNAQFSFYPKYLTLVESTTSLSEFYSSPPIKILNYGNPISSTDEISYLRSEKETLNTKLDTLNQEKLEWATSEVKLRLEITKIRLLATGEREEIYYLRDEKRNLQAKIDDLTKGLSEEKLQTNQYQNVLATYLAKCPQLEKHNQDLIGQLMLVNAEVEHLLKKKLPEPRFTFGTIINNIIKKCLIPLTLITVLSQRLHFVSQRFFNTKLRSLKAKIKSWRQDINCSDARGTIIGIIIWLVATAAVYATCQLDSLWFQEELKARNVPAPWHIPSPNDFQEQIKIENQRLHSANQLLKNQLTEIQQQLDAKK